MQIYWSIGLTLFLLWHYPLLMLLYLLWIYVDTTPSMGSLRWPHVTGVLRNMRIWNYVVDYFPARLVKTATLDPAGKYLFGYHPHGIISAGALLNFGTNATGFDALFPGVDLHVLGAKALFQIPFFREWLLILGGGSVGRKTCETLLGRGESIMIVVGGARESLEAHQDSDTIVLTLAERKGFVRVALKTGAALVPVVSFGENDIFAQYPNPKGSLLRRVQERILRLWGYTIPSFFGVGSFPLAAPSIGSFQYGLLPFRRPMTTIVGAPIEVPVPLRPGSRPERSKLSLDQWFRGHLQEEKESKQTDTTQSEGTKSDPKRSREDDDEVAYPPQHLVDEYHKKYIDALQALFDAHKDNVPRPPGAKVKSWSLKIA